MASNTLKQLQERRTAALTTCDRLQYDAFDMLIGVILSEVEMYSRDNMTIIRSREESLKEVQEQGLTAA